VSNYQKRKEENMKKANEKRIELFQRFAFKDFNADTNSNLRDRGHCIGFNIMHLALAAMPSWSLRGLS
jgi:hypothetical protein